VEAQEAGGVAMKTMKADEQLNWMKLNVYRFMNSESVTMMTAEEVGQYCLLLFTAWQLGKDCSLPNEPRYLDRVARGPVSQAVLSRFKEVDGRLVNEVQLAIWNEGKELWKIASESGKKGNEARWGKKADSESDRPPIAPQSGPDRELNRCEMNGNEMKRTIGNNVATVAAAAAVTEGSIPHSSSNGHHPTENPIAAPVSQQTPVPWEPFKEDDEDMEWGVLPKEYKLARLFYEGLPQENKDAAPPNWETMYAEDFASLPDNYGTIAAVIAYAERKLDKKTKERIYCRALTFVKNYHDLKLQWKKVSKVKPKHQPTLDRNALLNTKNGPKDAEDESQYEDEYKARVNGVQLPRPAEMMTQKEKKQSKLKPWNECHHGDGQWTRLNCPLCE
jgi:uncharacterized protein YdaU (DUF1376 family)